MTLKKAVRQEHPGQAHYTGVFSPLFVYPLFLSASLFYDGAQRHSLEACRVLTGFSLI